MDFIRARLVRLVCLKAAIGRKEGSKICDLLRKTSIGFRSPVSVRGRTYKAPPERSVDGKRQKPPSAVQSSRIRFAPGY